MTGPATAKLVVFTAYHEGVHNVSEGVTNIITTTAGSDKMASSFRTSQVVCSSIPVYASSPLAAPHISIPVLKHPPFPTLRTPFDPDSTQLLRQNHRYWNVGKPTALSFLGCCKPAFEVAISRGNVSACQKASISMNISLYVTACCWSRCITLPGCSRSNNQKIDVRRKGKM
jgi:hypothetical protein